jgi:hypothetical protein
MSADGRSLSMDAAIGSKWYVGSARLDGSMGEIWQEMDCCHNHAQFSPTDPDLMLLARDWWIDQATGQKTPHPAQRIWTIHRGGQARPLFPQPDPHNRAHEWWSADGQYVWFVDYVTGTERVHLASGKHESIWPAGTCHSHCDAGGQYLVGDIGTYQWASGCTVAFYNARTRKQINIVTSLPQPPHPRSGYHLDPHPQFCLGDRYICYTTTVLGSVDVAIVPTERLRQATA